MEFIHIARAAVISLALGFLIIPRACLAEYKVFIITHTPGMDPYTYESKSISELVSWAKDWYDRRLINFRVGTCNFPPPPEVAPFECTVVSKEEFFAWGAFPYRGFQLGFYTYPPFSPTKGIICHAKFRDCGQTVWEDLKTGALIGSPSYRIKIVSADSSSTHGDDYVADVGPTGTPDSGIATTTTLIAKVVDEDGESVPNIDIKISLKAVPSSGGHTHDTNDPTRPTGKLNGQSSTAGNTVSLNGTTGQDGFTFTYGAPEASGDYQVVASCTEEDCPQEGPDKIWVGIDGLVEIPPTAVWNLYDHDSTHSHPGSHYLNMQALSALAALASLYKGSFPDAPVLQLNDSSLERGGLFDCNIPERIAWWTTPHKEHRLGITIDVQANGTESAIPERNIKKFENIITKVIRGTYWEHSSHIHVRLLGRRG